MAQYSLGAPVRVSVEVRAAGDLVDPSTLTLVVTAPDGTVETYSSPSTSGTGLWYQDLPAADLPAVGRYRYVWTATGVGAGVQSGAFDVVAAPDRLIITLEDAKQHLNMSSTANDAEVLAMVAAATQVVERLAGAVVPRPVTEVVRQRGGCRSLMLMTRPVLSVTSLTSLRDSSTYDVSALYVDSPLAGIVRRTDGGAITGDPWTAVYQAGRAEIPANVGLATRMLVEHLWETQRGAASLNPPSMSVSNAEATPGIWFAIPNKVRELLDGEAVTMVAF